MDVSASVDLNAKVSLHREVTPGLLVMRVVPQGWSPPGFTAGQYTVLGLPGSAPRHVASDEDDPPRDPARLIRVAVLHGARHSWDLGYRSELITLSRKCPNLTYLPSISRPDEEPRPTRPSAAPRTSPSPRLTNMPVWAGVTLAVAGGGLLLSGRSKDARVGSAAPAVAANLRRTQGGYA